MHSCRGLATNLADTEDLLAAHLAGSLSASMQDLPTVKSCAEAFRDRGTYRAFHAQPSAQ